MTKRTKGKYGEKTRIAYIRVPESKYDEIMDKFYGVLLRYQVDSDFTSEEVTINKDIGLKDRFGDLGFKSGWERQAEENVKAALKGTGKTSAGVVWTENEAKSPGVSEGVNHLPYFESEKKSSAKHIDTLTLVVAPESKYKEGRDFEIVDSLPEDFVLVDKYKSLYVDKHDFDKFWVTFHGFVLEFKNKGKALGYMTEKGLK